jgi:hypothetical protein
VASHRKPKGIYTRNTPEWFIDKLAWAYGVADSNFATTTIFGLFNNDTSGRTLYVYRMRLVLIGGGHLFLRVFQEDLATNFDLSVTPDVQPGRAVNPQLAMPPGQWKGGGTSTPPPLDATLYRIYITESPSGPILGEYLEQAQFPLWILPTGYSLELFGDQTTQFVSGAFWYTYLPDAG